MVAVPFPLSLNRNPAGNAPISLNAGAGYPLATTVKLPACPTVNVADDPLVNPGGSSTLNVSCANAVPIELVAATVTLEEPAVPAAGVPEMVAVPFPLSLNCNPAGNAPISLNAGAGYPLATTVKLPACPTVNVADDPLVNPGG